MEAEFWMIFLLFTTGVRSRPSGPTLVPGVLLFCFLCPLLFSHFRGSQEADFHRPPYFEPTRSNIIFKIAKNFLRSRPPGPTLVPGVFLCYHLADA